MLKRCVAAFSFGGASFTTELQHLISRSQRLPSNLKERKGSSIFCSKPLANYSRSFAPAQLPDTLSRIKCSESTYEAQEIWNRLELLGAKAHALKETDTFFALFQYLVNKGYFPQNFDSWLRFATYFLDFSDVESTTVLQYPGYRVEQSNCTSHKGLIPTADLSKYVLNGCRGFSLSRQTLLMTGGVVPLMNRMCTSDGSVLHFFLLAFCEYVTLENGNGGLSSPHPLESEKNNYSHEFSFSEEHIVKAVLNMLHLSISFIKKNCQTVNFSFVSAPVAQLMRFFWEISLYRVLSSVTSRNESSFILLKEVKKQFSSLFELLLSVSEGGLGPAVALQFFSSFLFLDDWTGESEVWSSIQSNICIDKHVMDMHLSFFAQLQMENLLDVLRSIKNVDDDMKIDLLSMIRSVYGFLESFFQHNANHHNVFQISLSIEQKIRLIAAEVLLASMHREALLPDQFLQDAMEIIEKCAPSMFIEAVLLSAKVQLLEVYDLDKDKRAAVFKDLLTSLRNLVDLRPKQRSRAVASCSEDFDSESEVLDGEWRENSSCRLDAYSQKILQRAHEVVITVFSHSGEPEYLNEAYSIIISHKYHNLIVTKEVIKPLLRSFSKRGDGRAFNLVDLCVLYSNQTVDMEVFLFLFQVCAENGDYFRAKTMLKLLEDTIPGFLLKAPQEIKEALQSLKILPYESVHLFLSGEDIQISEAMGRKLDHLRSLPH